MFCIKCGNQIKDGYKFCSKCGTPVYVAMSKKMETESAPQETIIPNPLILEELDIEGVKKMAEKGNKVAMLQQAFRYEVGIGVEKDVEKAKELYLRTNRCDITSTEYSFRLDRITRHLYITKSEL